MREFHQRLRGCGAAPGPSARPVRHTFEQFIITEFDVGLARDRILPAGVHASLAAALMGSCWAKLRSVRSSCSPCPTGSARAPRSWPALSAEPHLGQHQLQPVARRVHRSRRIFEFADTPHRRGSPSASPQSHRRVPSSGQSPCSRRWKLAAVSLAFVCQRGVRPLEHAAGSGTPRTS